MFYFLSALGEEHIFFNVLRYITFRSAMAAITAFLICVIFGPRMIRGLSRLGAVGNTQRPHAEKIHNLYEHKKQIPTMGGLLILVGVILSNLFWADITNRFVILVLIVIIWYGLLGFVDDYLKVRFQNSQGIHSRTKFFGQLSLATLFALYLYWDPVFDTQLTVPFFKNISWTLGIFYIPLVIGVMVGTSNAINLTDGLDGLAVGCMTFAAGAFAIIAYLVGNSLFANYLQMPFIDGAGELAVVSASLVGASVGFFFPMLVNPS